MRHFGLLFLSVMMLLILFMCLSIGMSSSNNPKNTIYERNGKSRNWYMDRYFNLANFNYEGECSKVFKSKKNNERDLLLFGGSFPEIKSWKESEELSYAQLKMSQETIPNAKKVFMLIGDPPTSDFISNMNECGVEVVQANGLPQENGAVTRFCAWLNYLKENKGKYDRVALSDIRDVFIFGDAFATFSKDEIYLSYECLINKRGNVECNDFRDIWNREWINQFYGEDIARQYAENHTLIVNAGFTFGGYDKIVEYLTVFTESIDQKHFKYWGYDQALLSYLYTTRKLDFLNPKMAKCDQQFCFELRGGSRYDPKKKSLYVGNSECSPVIRHKLIVEGSVIRLT
ncbi:hypothetical protein EDI_285410 [Entamoeba dispar SAW760]|uniref:Uncharacterized protein n=1 Tax=Entamoeba dispar (strain ATCC PRA-260 / SAW760) TaxID=370354 RepID=B0EKB9_ENTDS|nr:uncharacterized protein EDI_285410 [Entamoeba dispar SAW760]EDR25026.1 hypothetical protein EDI_285410 [Entamoeba dispar SAW760]|eukprot:EDR25026.1 hypothetical protein EDI_285410 [Entamoeba dispar SAW760]